MHLNKILKISTLLSFILFVGITSCTECVSPHRCGDNETDRVGCECRDGTFSDATGSGACSGHGGVKYWHCGC